MRKRIGLILVALLLVAGGAIAWFGDVDPDVNLYSAAEVWADVLRDGDQLGLHLTRISDRREMDLGARVASRMVYQSPSVPAEEARVARVGARLEPYVRRRAIHYTFHVIDFPDVNAFALPGGHVFVFTGLLAQLQSDDELAFILGHEMSHVDLRHAVELYQTEAAFEKIGVAPIGQVTELVRRLVARGYSKFQELEADAQGLRMCTQAGYDPDAAVRMYARIWPGFGTSTEPVSPVDEATGAVTGVVTTYFDTHPTDQMRLHRLQALAARNRKRAVPQ